MKKLKKIGKIAIPTVAMVASGLGAVKTYGDYNKIDGSLELQNVEALSESSSGACETCINWRGIKVDVAKYVVDAKQGWETKKFTWENNRKAWSVDLHVLGRISKVLFSGVEGITANFSHENTTTVNMLWPTCVNHDKTLCPAEWEANAASGAVKIN